LFAVGGMTRPSTSAIVVGATRWGNTAITPALVSSAGAGSEGLRRRSASVRLAERIVHVDEDRLSRGGPRAVERTP
jgi:hypothetical protein